MIALSVAVRQPLKEVVVGVSESNHPRPDGTEVTLQMKQEPDPTKSNRSTESQPPLISAADVRPGNYPRARFDEGIALTIQEIGCCRAPTRSSEWRHQVGFAGELTAAAYFGVKADRTITGDFIGDDGYDFVHNGRRIQVKTTTREEDWSLEVSVGDVNKADYYVLAACPNPTELVELIGWIPRSQLKQLGHKFKEDGRLRVDPDSLYPFEPIFLPPEQIRRTQQV